MAEVFKTFVIALDTKVASYAKIPVIEGDTGNRFVITLTDDGTAVDLSTSRVTAVFSGAMGTAMQDSWSGTDGQLVISGTSHNIVTFDLLNGSFANGLNKCELQVYSGATYTTLITSASFNFDAKKPILNDDTIASTSEYPILVSLIDQVEALTDREQADWTEDDTESGTFIQNKPSEFTPSAHASTHATGEDDEITPADIGAAAASHASTHATGGDDELTPEDIGAVSESAFDTHASRHAVAGDDPTTKRFSAAFVADDWDETDFIQAKTDVSGGSVTITPATFKTAVSDTEGTYVFTYANATSEWKLDDTGVTLADYGIVLTGSPSDEDTITAQYKVCHVQAVSVTGVTSDMVMKVDLSLSESALIDDRLAQVEAFSLVGRVDSTTGGVTLTCYDGAPEVEFSVQMEVAL